MRCFAIALALAATVPAIGAGTPQETDELTATVTRMARVGSCVSPSFSPDGQRLAVICDLSGTPQVWITATDGGWPTQVTALEDPVTRVDWSPVGNWLASRWQLKFTHLFNDLRQLPVANAVPPKGERAPPQDGALSPGPVRRAELTPQRPFRNGPGVGASAACRRARVHHVVLLTGTDPRKGAHL